jgi:hypothetical protein
MKKNYSKPEIVFESFKMTTSVAGPCVHKGNSSDQNTCDFDTGVGVIFAQALVCNEADGEFNVQDGEFDFCYDTPTADQRVFAS